MGTVIDSAQLRGRLFYIAEPKIMTKMSNDPVHGDTFAQYTLTPDQVLMHYLQTCNSARLYEPNRIKEDLLALRGSKNLLTDGAAEAIGNLQGLEEAKAYEKVLSESNGRLANIALITTNPDGLTPEERVVRDYFQALSSRLQSYSRTGIWVFFPNVGAPVFAERFSDFSERNITSMTYLLEKKRSKALQKLSHKPDSSGLVIGSSILLLLTSMGYNFYNPSLKAILLSIILPALPYLISIVRSSIRADKEEEKTEDPKTAFLTDLATNIETSYIVLKDNQPAHRALKPIETRKQEPESQGHKAERTTIKT